MGLRNVLSRGSDDEDDETADENLPYRYTTESTERVQGTEVIAKGVDTELPEGHRDRDVTFASKRARQMLAHGRWDSDAPIWLGIGTRRGRDVSIEQRSMFRHLACFGTTGYGKSTFQKNSFRQIAELGAGGCYIDPGGDDAEELLEILPEHRLDDVVWIEPGSTRGRVSGFNFLNTSIPPESPQFEHAVESLVADFRHMLAASQGWGARMDGVTASLIRASANTEYEFTPADLFYIIESAENSRRFAEAVRASGLELLADSADKIADVAENDPNALEPLWRRFKDWVESPIARQFMSLRDSPIDIANAVADNKLIIVRLGPEDEDLKQMIGTAIFRRIWSVIRARAEMDRSERTPFYLFADEFDNLASQDGAIDTMLSESRKYRLSLFLSCQAPRQIQDVLPSLAANCDTWVSFSPGSPKDSRIVANNIGMEPETLQRDTAYHIWLTLDMPDRGQSSEPFRAYTLPEFPPLRTRDERDEMIDEYLYDHGLPTQTAEEVRDSILIRGGEGALEQSGALGIDSMVTEENIPTDTILVCIFVAAVRASEDNDETDPVTTDRVHEEFENRTGVEMTEAKFSQQLEMEYGGHVEELKEGKEKVRLTGNGLTKLFQQDTGSAENAGGPTHRRILRESFKTFLALGAAAYLPTQDSGELPDGVADLPINPLADATTDREYEALKETCETEYGRLYDLSDGKDIAIEAETTTLDKPKQTLTNLRKAVEQGKKCVFACKDGSYDPDNFEDEDDIPDHSSLFEYWPRRGERVIHYTEGSVQNISTDFDRLTFVNETIDPTAEDEGDADGDDDDDNDEDDELAPGRIFYNEGEPMSLESGVGALRPKTASSMRWRERSTGDADTDTEIVLEDKGGRGTIRARFETIEAVFDADREDVPAYYENTPDGYVVHANGTQGTYDTKEAMKKDFKPIYPPFIPEREFTDASGDTRLPTADDFMFVVFPDDNNDEYDEPHIYEHGELRPLVPDESDDNTGSNTAEKDTPTEDEVSPQQAAESDEHDSESVSDGQVESTDAPPQCPDCEECNRWSADGRNGNLICENCEYMPEKQVRDEIRHKRDGQEESTDSEQEQSSTAESEGSTDADSPADQASAEEDNQSGQYDVF
jgi:hypothetical protein